MWMSILSKSTRTILKGAAWPVDCSADCGLIWLKLWWIVEASHSYFGTRSSRVKRAISQLSEVKLVWYLGGWLGAGHCYQVVLWSLTRWHSWRARTVFLKCWVHNPSNFLQMLSTQYNPYNFLLMLDIQCVSRIVDFWDTAFLGHKLKKWPVLFRW